MKKIILVFVFIGGFITGAYLLDPVIKDVRADDFQYDNEYYYEGHCGYDEDFLGRFIDGDLTTEQVDLITLRFEELLIEHEITEEELYDDMEITHDIMLDMISYIESLGIEYYPSYHRGHMFR